MPSGNSGFASSSGCISGFAKVSGRVSCFAIFSGRVSGFVRGRVRCLKPLRTGWLAQPDIAMQTVTSRISRTVPFMFLPIKSYLRMGQPHDTIEI
jgi:hypothetical protein